jgi:glycosyltransferase involved in cell wall biosynthesis
MSNRVKIELVASLLKSKSHDVEIFSPGEVDRPQFKFYPGFSEPDAFDASIPVYYSSALPIRRVHSVWSCNRILRLFKERHLNRPFDVVIVFNMRPQQLACAEYAMRRLGLPVILQYEDDAFLSVVGEEMKGRFERRRQEACRRLLGSVAGGTGVSPHLLSQFPAAIPKLLFRGAVSQDVLDTGTRAGCAKKNWVLYSGTHVEWNGVAELIDAWASAPISGWELHITGYGQQTQGLKESAKNVREIVFHGLLPRDELVRLLCSAKICVNAQRVSQTQGNFFPFKIIEYLAAGAHVISTPMGRLEPEIEQGITYMPDNNPATIASTLRGVVQTGRWESDAAGYVCDTYGPKAIADSLDQLLVQVTSSRFSRKP